MAQLTGDAVDFARSHITQFYDTDFFPKPFEFFALWAFWGEVREYFLGKDVADLPVRSLRAVVAPKPNGSYRVVHQLDPLDSLLYTALAYEISPSIEAARAPVGDRIACSYRISIDPDRGTFFGEGNGYGPFLTRSRELAGTHPHVLVVDLIDFYNQIYVHRLQNAIEYADADLTDLSRDIEDYIMRLNGRVSRGVPVGPAASIVMTEAVLIDVDQYIRNSGFLHTRYVDDFHIFAEREEHLMGFLREFILYLYNVHRLVISSAKTQVYRTDIFLDEILDDPERAEEAALHNRIDQIEPITDYDFLGVDEPQQHVARDDVRERSEVLQDVLAQVIQRGILSLGLARHALRKCRRLRLRAIVPQLLDNFDFFAPVINDLVLYLRRVSNPRFLDLYGDELERIALNSGALDTPLVSMWFLGYVANQRRLCTRPGIVRAIRERGDISVQAQFAVTTRDLAWARTQRDRLTTFGDWERRAVLQSLKVLPRPERRAWLDTYANRTPDPLEQWLTRWVASL